MNLGDLGEQCSPDLFRLPHPIRHQTHIRGTDSQFLSDSGIESEMAFVNAKKMMPI